MAVRKAKKAEIQSNEIQVVTTLSAAQITAARTLAFGGYRKGGRHRSGAMTLAAERAGVTRMTVYLWTRLPEFEAEIEKTRAEGLQIAWNGYFLSASQGDVAACNAINDRMDPDASPKVYQEKVKHKNAKELLKLRAELGIPPDEGNVTYQILVGEFGEPGFEELPGEEMH